MDSFFTLSGSSSAPSSPPLRPRPSAPHVPPGTSINVNSFAMVKQAAKKAHPTSAAETKSNKGSQSSSTKKKPPPTPKAKSESENETSEEDDDDDSDDEVQISREAMKKAEKIKKASESSKKKSEPSSKKAPPAKKSTTPASSKAKPKPAAKKESTKKETTKAGSSKPGTSSGGRGGSMGTRRKTKARRATSSGKGNLASELLDMLLSTDDEEFEGIGDEQDSSDEAWK